MSLRGTMFAATYDRMMKRAEAQGLATMRADLLGGASGQVLEIGGGTGANLTYYGPAVESLTVTEPEAPMFKRLDRHARAATRETIVLRAPAEDLPFEDATFDVVVSTLVLCGVDDQPRAVREIRRVLRPGGRLLFLEHVRSTEPRLSRQQDRLNWLNRLVVCCECNRPTLDTIKGAGFTVTTVDEIRLPNAPFFVRPAVIGTATAPPVRRPSPSAEGGTLTAGA
jgi:ubiquinone/menaquinone biosynthesis C-methylase UbiE